MTNETTASQPKSIGDDAQFRKLMLNFMNYSTATLPLRDQPEYRAITEFLDSRAPAAQASATIQAAPGRERIAGISREECAALRPDEVSDRLRADAAGGMACNVFVLDRAADLLLSAPMVADPAGVAKPCGWLAGNSSDGGEMMYWKREDAQSECDQHNAYERSRPDFDEINLRAPEAVYLAATVKAVPSEALEAFAYFVQPSGFGPFIECSAQQPGSFAAYRAVKSAAPLAGKTGGGE